MLKFFKKMKKNRKGYTLTELIVVVAILGILAAVATPMIMGQIDKANVAADKANAKIIENIIAVNIADQTLSSSSTKDQIQTAVEKSMNVPACKVKDNHFLVTLATGKVEATTTAAEDKKSVVLTTT